MRLKKIKTIEATLNLPSVSYIEKKIDLLTEVKDYMYIVEK